MQQAYRFNTTKGREKTASQRIKIVFVSKKLSTKTISLLHRYAVFPGVAENYAC